MCNINAHCKIWNTAGRLISCCHYVHGKYADNRILGFKQDIIIINCVKHISIYIVHCKLLIFMCKCFASRMVIFHYRCKLRIIRQTVKKLSHSRNMNIPVRIDYLHSFKVIKEMSQSLYQPCAMQLRIPAFQLVKQLLSVIRSTEPFCDTSYKLVPFSIKMLLDTLCIIKIEHQPLKYTYIPV